MGAPWMAVQALGAVGIHLCSFPSLTLALGLSAKSLRHQVHYQVGFNGPQQATLALPGFPQHSWEDQSCHAQVPT